MATMCASRSTASVPHLSGTVKPTSSLSGSEGGGGKGGGGDEGGEGGGGDGGGDGGGGDGERNSKSSRDGSWSMKNKEEPPSGFRSLNCYLIATLIVSHKTRGGTKI